MSRSFLELYLGETNRNGKSLIEGASHEPCWWVISLQSARMHYLWTRQSFALAVETRLDMHNADCGQLVLSQQHFASNTSKQASRVFLLTIAVVSAITPNDWCNDTRRLPSNATHQPPSVIPLSPHFSRVRERYGYNNNGADNAAIPQHILQTRGPKSTSWASSVNKLSNKQQAMHKWLCPGAIFLTALCGTFGSLQVQCSLNGPEYKCKPYSVVVQSAVAGERAPGLL